MITYAIFPKIDRKNKKYRQLHVRMYVYHVYNTYMYIRLRWRPSLLKSTDCIGIYIYIYIYGIL